MYIKSFGGFLISLLLCTFFICDAIKYNKYIGCDSEPQ